MTDPQQQADALSDRVPYDPLAADPLPRPFTARGWLIVGVVVGLFALAWLGVFATYKVTGTTVGQTEAPAEPVDGIGVLLEPRGFDPAENEMTVRLQFLPTGELMNSDGSLTQDVVVSVESFSGVAEVTLARGRQPATQEITVGTEGNYATYPLDDYTASVGIIADAVMRDAGGQITDKVPIPLAIQISGSVDGWDVDVANPAPGPADYVEGSIHLDRSGNTLLFTFFLLGLMTILVLVGIALAVLTSTHRRSLGVDLLGWFATLLFALPFLRQVLPGAPPVGAAIDVYVFLWLLAFALVATVVVVVAWLRQNRATLLKTHHTADRQRE